MVLSVDALGSEGIPGSFHVINDTVTAFCCWQWSRNKLLVKGKGDCAWIDCPMVMGTPGIAEGGVAAPLSACPDAYFGGPSLDLLGI